MIIISKCVTIYLLKSQEGNNSDYNRMSIPENQKKNYLNPSNPMEWSKATKLMEPIP